MARVDPLETGDMKAGESYDSWICQACSNVIALAPRAPAGDPRDMPDALVSIQCPHCQARRNYTIHDRRVRQYTWVVL